jgi:hypothetical protein
MPFANLFRARKRLSHGHKEADKMKNCKSAAGSPYVTRDELDALTRVVGIALARVQLAHERTGFADGRVATQLAVASREPMPEAQRIALERIVEAFESAIEKHHAAERRNSRTRGHAYYDAPSWK